MLFGTMNKQRKGAKKCANLKTLRLRKLESTKCLIRDAELLAVVAARAEPTMRNWLGELVPRTGQVAGGKCPNTIGG